MTFSKGLLITALSLVFFAVSSPVRAEAPNPAAPVAAQPAAEPTAAKKEEAAKPAMPVTSPVPGPEKADAQLRAEQKVDTKNLPENVTPLIPQEGEAFVIGVGESKIISAARPRKCLQKEAPSFDETRLRLPPNEFISYSDGGVRQRFSRRCGGMMAARVVIATGLKKGTIKLEILGAELNILVK